MEESYKIRVDDSLDFQLTQKDILELDLSKTGAGKYHLLKNNVSYHIQVLEVDLPSRSYNLAINGTEHHIKINDSLDELIEKMGFAVNGSKNVDSIAAPMPGLILDIFVEVGKEVKEEEQLLVLEAMKMENIITSPRDGVIKSIAVKQGEAVDKKQLLIEFE